MSSLTGGFALRGAWYTDGDWIVFSLNPPAASDADNYIMREDGTDLHQVTRTPDQDEEFGDWR